MGKIWIEQNRYVYRTSRGCTEQNEGHRIISFTSFAWISSKDRILWSLVWRILLWANTQFVQRFSTQSRHRAVAWELSSQLVHFVGFWTARTVNMLLMKKFSGNASIPLAGTGTTRRHIEQTRVRSWGLEIKKKKILTQLLGTGRSLDTISWIQLSTINICHPLRDEMYARTNFTLH